MLILKSILLKIVNKLEPIDILVAFGITVITILLLAGKDGVILGLLNTLVGALIRGMIKNEK